MNSPEAETTPMVGAPGAATEPDNESEEKAFANVNIAEDLDEDKLNKFGEECKRGFEQDLRSRDDWERCIDEWTKLAMQIKEEKTYPWPKASNVKYPILSTAAMQFNARAYPSLIPSDGKVVKGKVLGKDPKGEKGLKAERVATYMSYQFMHEMQSWDEEMDKMLIMLPILGTMFKKTYWNGATKAICSDLVLPKSLVVNNWARTLEEAERISEIIPLSKRLVEERKRQGLFLDIDYGTPVAPIRTDATQKDNHVGIVDDTTPYEFIEQHT